MGTHADQFQQLKQVVVVEQSKDLEMPALHDGGGP
jgi:hypothetical protein